MMKRGVKVLLGVLALGIVASGLAFAERPDLNKMVNRRVQRLEKRLNLTDDQAGRLKPILEQFAQQRRSEMEARRAKFRSILTPDQVAKLDQMKADWKAKRQEERAERKSGEERAEGKHEGFRHHRREGFKKFAQKLGLTPDQIAQIKSLRKDSFAQMKSDRQQLFAQTRTVLDATQEKKFERMLSHHGRRFRHGHGRWMHKHQGESQKTNRNGNDNFSTP